ncbi:MAG: response regulator [Actinomycetota bacterium]
MAKIRVLVADSQVLVSDALSIALGLYNDLEVLAEHPKGAQEAVDMASILRPDVAVFDFWLEGMDGPVVVSRILQDAPGQKIILLSWFYSPGHVRDALDAGAVAFLPKSVKVERLVEAIRRAQAGESPVFAEELSRLVQTVDKRYEEKVAVRKRLEGLTKRELEILSLLSSGRPMKELAEELHVAPGTLKVHVHNMLTKTATRNQQELLSLARYCGMII